MSNIGSVLTALIGGAAQGFVEAEQEDKLKQETEKLAVKQRRFDMAKLIFGDEAATPEAKQIALQVMSDGGGGKGVKTFDQFVAIGSMTQDVPGRTASALPQGQAAAPLNQEGNIPQDAQAGITEGAQREAPLALDSAPQSVAVEQAPPETAPTPEALEREVIIEPTTEEIPLFRSPDEVAREKGRLGVIEAAAGLDDKERRTVIIAEKKAIAADKALTKAIEAAASPDSGIDADLVANLIRSGMTGNEAFQQGGLDKKPTKVQRRTFTKAAMTSAFFGLATIAEAKAQIPDWEVLSDVEIKGLRDAALLDRKNKERVAGGSTLTVKEAGEKWNAALGAAKKIKKRDPNEILPTFISLSGVELQERIDVELLARGVEPTQVRDLVERPFENIPDLSRTLSSKAQRAISSGKAEALPQFRRPPDPSGVATQVGRKSKNSVDIAIELFKKDLE